MCLDCETDHDHQIAKSPYFLGLHWTPMNTCLEHRLQTLAVFFIFGTAPLFMIAFPAIFFYILFFTSYQYLALIYLAWMIWDRNTPHQGGRSILAARKMPLFHHFANFFPVKLHKTEDLSPNHNYIFALHPHGIFASSHFACFASEGTGFSQKFPGITTYMYSLKHFYYLPIAREIMMLAGALASSKESISYNLNMKKRGVAACIPIGGAAEAMNTDPVNIRVVLKNRKGFVRLALMHGAHLVPVFSFGENDLFEELNSLPGSLFRRFQDAVRRVIGVPPYLFRGRGIFQYDFGIVPFKKPVNVVVGAAIEVPHRPDPTQQEIDKLHQLYMDRLQELFDKHHKFYSPHSTILFV